jgi:hypothetical protein
VDAVGIEGSHGIAPLPFPVTDNGSLPQHGVVYPVGRVNLASNEGERIEGAGRKRGAKVICALYQPILVADASIEQHAVDELRAMVEIEEVLIADLKIDAKTQDSLSIGSP